MQKHVLSVASLRNFPNNNNFLFYFFQVVTIVHFCLISNALMGFWPNAYLFVNVLFLISLFWSIHSTESVDAVNTVIFILRYGLKLI